MGRAGQLEKTIYIETKKNLHQASRIIVLTGSRFQEYDLKKMGKDRIFFGRDENKCDIVIPVPTVSGVHGKIKFANGATYVGDMGSTNGMYLFQGHNYERMIPRKYYKKNAGDWIFRIDSSGQSSSNPIVIILTDSENKSAWKCTKLQDGITAIGRDPRNHIVMETPNFSRCHAVIYKQGNQYMVMDKESMNGVYVNGTRVKKQQIIGEKDMIQIAGSLFILLAGNLMYQSCQGGVSLSMENISKTVGKGKNSKKILNHVYCDIGSNEFVAIIGGSGAGKTTVMNAMSGFDEELSGRVLCNGIDLHKNFAALKNMIGFVPQQDIIYENLTLQKMLAYTAKMKMPSDIGRNEMHRRILKVLEMVDLTEYAGAYIRKLSGGQKKRASIAVEMLADPGLFFLDEPTSGLDPDTEQALMHTLARLSKEEGKTIIMVTHTTQSIHLCDKVVFMGPGGKICYCGPPSEICEYFGQKELVDVYNVLSKDVDNWNGYYLQTYMAERGKEQTQMGVAAAHGQQPSLSRHSSARQVSALRQMFVLIARYTELIWNDRQRLMLLMIQPVAIAFLLAIVAVDNTFIKFEDTQSIMFALSCSGIWIGLFNTIQEVCKERPILKREYMGNLKLWTYIVSKYVVQGVICFVQATLLTSLFLALIEHYIEAGVFFKPGIEVWLTMVLTIYASASMGLIVSAFVKNGDRAMAIAPFVLIIQLLFSGVLFALSGPAKMISKITVSRWAMECLGNITNLNKLPSKVTSDGSHVADDFYVRTGTHLIHTWELLLLVAVICGVISVVVLRNLKKDHR